MVADRHRRRQCPGTRPTPCRVSLALPRPTSTPTAPTPRADKDDLPLGDPQRRAYEQLLRKLLRLPGAPAVVQVRARCAAAAGVAVLAGLLG